jgi:hypothetical protein
MKYIIEDSKIWSAHKVEMSPGHYFPIKTFYEPVTKLNKIVYQFTNWTFIGELNDLFKVAKSLDVIVDVDGYVYYNGEYVEINKENKLKLYDFIIQEFYSFEPNKELLVKIINQLKLWA